MLSYVPNVTIQKYRLWTPEREGANEVQYCVFTDEKGDRYELPVHHSLNGGTPAVGEKVGLVVHSYAWSQARVSRRTNEPYIATEEKRRVVGSFDSAKFTPPAARVADEFAAAA